MGFFLRDDAPGINFASRAGGRGDADDGQGIGGAAVSEKHAGFVVNRGGATTDDIRRTMELVQTRVLETSGVQLEPEVRIW